MVKVTRPGECVGKGTRVRAPGQVENNVGRVIRTDSLNKHP